MDVLTRGFWREMVLSGNEKKRLISIPVWRPEISDFHRKQQVATCPGTLTLVASLVNIGGRLRSVLCRALNSFCVTDALSDTHTSTDFIIRPMLLMHHVNVNYHVEFGQ